MAAATSWLQEDGLARRSVEVLLEGQAASGGFVASPNFATYRYSWLRDGAFCAYALDLAGRPERAAAFHRWVAGCIAREHRRIEAVIERLGDGETPPEDLMLPARFTLDGDREPAGPEKWPNFQLDGYGMWLWALEQHARGQRPTTEVLDATQVVADYLVAAWQLPCYDCWEEFGDGRHAGTRAAVARGLAAAAVLLGTDSYAQLATSIRGSIFSAFLRDGYVSRGLTDDRVDGSLLWLAEPFDLEPVDHPHIVATVDRIRRDLIGPSGGVRRYLGDSYYGGGEWLLLTSSLAWYDALTGNKREFEQLRGWVRDQAQAKGDLPEQVIEYPQQAEMVSPWLERWGEIATPLLWSHAMYLVAEDAAAAAGWNSSR